MGLSEQQPCETTRSLDITQGGISITTKRTLLYGLSVFNIAGAAARFVKIYDLATTPNPASDVPKMTIALGAASTTNNAWRERFVNPVHFTNGIQVRCSTAVGDTDTGAPGAGNVIGYFLHRQLAR